MPITGLPDGSVVGTVTLHLPYQGPPGYVHGGVSALLLDHTLGVANFWAGASGRTGELTLRYHRPTPLFTELAVRGRQTSVDGRKIRTEGEISTADGTVCVSAKGLFITPRPEDVRFGRVDRSASAGRGHRQPERDTGVCHPPVVGEYRFEVCELGGGPDMQRVQGAHAGRGEPRGEFECG